MSQKQAASAHLNRQKYLEARANARRLSQRKLYFAINPGRGDGNVAPTGRGGGGRNRSMILIHRQLSSNNKSTKENEDTTDITMTGIDDSDPPIETATNKESTPQQEADTATIVITTDENLIPTSKKCFPKDMPIDIEPLDSWLKELYIPDHNPIIGIAIKIDKSSTTNGSMKPP
jgi:hypothetical protein